MVRDLKAQFPEFGTLMEERLAQYQAKTEARVPLDFTTEMLPAEIAAHDKVDSRRRSTPRRSTSSFADEADFSGNAESASARSSTIEQIDEMDCGAAVPRA